jgi:ATP-dependent RNA/DNA helicase IGHMBP2
MEYFNALLDLLKTEREEDLRIYQKLTVASSITDRRANGLSLYPIAIRGTEIGRGDYLTIELERTTHQDLNHQFRFGSSAVLFSNHQPGIDRLEGTITYSSGNKLKIALRVDELPEWASDGKLGIDLLFDNNSYDEMQSALKSAASLINDTNEGHLVRTLTGMSKPGSNPLLIPKKYPLLNSKQELAVNNILAANELSIVHGPPGTGKTTTLVQAIKALIRNDNKQILVVAPSNTAVDLLSEKLAAEGLNVLRIGNPSRVSTRLLALTLDSKISEHESYKDIKKLKKQAAEFKSMAHKYKRNFGKAEQEQRKALFNEAHKIVKEASKTEQYIIDHVVSKAQVVAATLVGSNHHTIRDIKFNTVVIDEAGQALEPACWIPILKAKKVIFAGDHCQLSPTIKSQEASRKGLNVTLMEKCIKLYPESVVLLEEQYRMHKSIMGYSSKVFYNNQLTAHQSVKEHLLFEADVPLEFIDTAGCGYEEKSEGIGIGNPEEAVFLIRHLSRFIKELENHYSINEFPSLGIISPYQQQIKIIKDLVLNSPELQMYSNSISINTIDSFQGQERDLIFISLTRSNSEGSIGFLSDIRRMNVAMTRAKKKLLIIGDSATLSRLPFYKNLIEYAAQLNFYHSAWEFIEE